ncbi:hypothetical protein IU470_25835 [Nocardia abscessus]|uniref:Uncharacterized protein n=1 Tax=Nocardia abscessus TaxID=120957 RepID=A0ABS0CF79_9NOCA|nr:hypothetical protein [Nocardia abscessus]MBF6228515.1 hypothetical protein [Nocardia abscessus]
MTRQVRLALFGASGAGKSTTCRLLLETVQQRGLAGVLVKLAEPLYDVQRLIYSLCGHPVIEPYRQDGILLSSLADNFRRIDPGSLTRLFAARVAGAEKADVVICDDMRRPDYEALREMGFRFVRITAPEAVRIGRRTARDDLAPVSDAHAAETPISLAPDFEVLNDSSFEHLARQVHAITDVIANSWQAGFGAEAPALSTGLITGGAK